MDVFSKYNNGIGDWFISDEQKKINESNLKDAELQREQQAALLEELSRRNAMASGSNSTDQTSLAILMGVGVLFVFVIIMTT